MCCYSKFGNSGRPNKSLPTSLRVSDIPPCRSSMLPAGHRWQSISIIIFKATKLQPVALQVRRCFSDVFFWGLSSMKNVLHRSNSIDCKAIPQTKTARTVPSRYRRLCAIEHKRHTRTRRGADPKAARKAAEALSRLLHQRSFVRDGLGNFMVILSSAWANLPPQQVAAALLAVLRRHPGHADMQFYGCRALHHLCECFPALPAMLRSDASVLTSVRAAAAVRPFCRWQAGLEKCDWYTHELCMWLQPCLLCGWWALIFAQVTS